MRILSFVIENRCVCVHVRVRACVCVRIYARGSAREGEKNRAKGEALSLRLHKTKSTVMSFSCVFCESVCSLVCMYVGVLVCVCVLFLAVSSQCVLFSFPNETLTIIFSKGESKDSKRDQG